MSNDEYIESQKAMLAMIESGRFPMLARLAEHPEVSECIVLGIDHPDLGQEVAAVVVATPDADVDSLGDRLREHAAAALAYFKVPTQWRVTRTPLPRNATGKVVRRDVEL